MNILNEIRMKRESDIMNAESIVPLEVLREKCRMRTDFRSMDQALSEPGIRIVAEIKQASPSRGTLAEKVEPERIACDYAAGGAAAISVLTEPNYFLGSLDILRKTRAAVTLPVLQKDFIFSEYQLYEGTVAGADAVLLIVRMLSEHELIKLFTLALELGVTPIVEIYDSSELTMLKHLPAHQWIGINNRNLSTLQTDTLHASKLINDVLEQEKRPIVFSGIQSRLDLQHYLELTKAFLIGTYLMTAPNRKAALQELLA